MKYIDKTNRKTLDKFLKIREKFIFGGMKKRLACEAIAELCVDTYDALGHDTEPCLGIGCGTTPECDECGFTPKEVAIATIGNYSTLVQELCEVGEFLVKEEGYYCKGYKRLHHDFGHLPLSVLMCVMH